MNDLIQFIREQNYQKAGELLEDKFHQIMESKLLDMKKALASKEFGVDNYVIEEVESLDEKRRFRIVRVRIRKGKVQRRKKVSNVKGYTFRKGKFIRMSATERRHRRMGQRRGKIKRRSHRSIARMHFKRALRKRHALGL